MDVQSFSAQFVFGIDQYDEIETRSVDSAEQVGVVVVCHPLEERWRGNMYRCRTVRGAGGLHVPLVCTDC